MGLGIESTTFLERVKAMGVNFDRTAMIGRQQMYTAAGAGDYAEDYLHSLGASEVTSFDASNYEKAENIHDFNLPLPTEFHNRYTVVLDGGTLEHVFDFPRAISNCMKMVDVGGHLLILTPTNGYSGHGFYQFSPDLFYRVLSPDNGFAVRLMMCWQAGSSTNYYEIKDGERNSTANGAGCEMLLMVCAEKVTKVPMFGKPIQQSGYSEMWAHK